MMRPWPRAYRYRDRPMVRWLSPREVVRGGYGEFFGRLFGAFADNRETQASLRRPVVHHACKPTTEASLAPPLAGQQVMLCNDQLPWHTGAGSGEPTEVWMDYFADIGDGFSATYTVAEQMAEPVTSVESEGRQLRLPKADLLVMGGDGVYPAASQENYRDRTVGPYRTAFPGHNLLGEDHDGPDIDLTAAEEGGTTLVRTEHDPVPWFSIPGNHDWYDGLSAFLERFTVYNCGDGVSPKRAWSIHQTRSYFATQLSDRWWLWGVDVALSADIDTPQMMYFRQVASIMPADSRIILCTAKPSWLKRPKPSSWSRFVSRLTNTSSDATPPDDGWEQLTYFIDSTLGPSGSRSIRLVLSGDKHFLSLHEPEDPTYPTVAVSGGGGGYLSSTRESPAELELGWYFGQDPEVVGDGGTVEYRNTLVWPSKVRALLQGLTGLWLIPWRNPEMAGVLGVMSLLFALAARAGVSSDKVVSDDGKARLEPFADDALWIDQLDVFWGATQNLGGWALAVLATAAFFGMAKAHRRSTPVAVIATAGHLLLHAYASTLTAAVAARWAIAGQVVNPPAAQWDQLGQIFTDGRWPTTAFVLFCLALGSVAGIAAFAVYLVIAQMFKMNLNELFAGLRSRHYKQFLRIHVTDEKLAVHAIGFARVPRRRLKWVDGAPRVTASTASPELVGAFTVPADPNRRETLGDADDPNVDVRVDASSELV